MSTTGNPVYSNYGNYGYGSQRVYSTGFGNPMFGQVSNNPYVTGQNYAPFAFGNNYSPYYNTQYYGTGAGNPQSTTPQQTTTPQVDTNGQGWYSESASTMAVGDNVLTTLEKKLSVTRADYFNTDSQASISLSEVIDGLNKFGPNTVKGQALAKDTDTQKLLAENGILLSSDGIYHEAGYKPIKQSLMSNVQANLAIDFQTLDVDSNGRVTQNELIKKLNTITPDSYDSDYIKKQPFLDLLKESGIEYDATKGKFGVSGTTISAGQSTNPSQSTVVGEMPTKFNFSVTSFDTLVNDGVVTKQELINGLNSIAPSTANGAAMAADSKDANTDFAKFLQQNNLMLSSSGLNNGNPVYYEKGQLLLGSDVLGQVSQKLGVTAAALETDGRNGTTQSELITKLNSYVADSPNAVAVRTTEMQTVLTKYDINLNPSTGQFEVSHTTATPTTTTPSVTKSAEVTTFENAIDLANKSIGPARDAAIKTALGAATALQQNPSLLTGLDPAFQTAITNNSGLMSSTSNPADIVGHVSEEFAKDTKHGGIAVTIEDANRVKTGTSSQATSKQNLLEALASNLGVSFTGSNQATLESRMEGQVISKGGPDISNNNGLVSDAEIAAYANSAASKANTAAHDKLEAALLAAGFKKENDLIVANADSPVLGVVGGAVQKDGKGTGR